jgi:SAM-dependent methyltransferase
MPEEKAGWDDIACWWRRAATTDPVYRQDVESLLRRVMPANPGVVVELGCGEGQWLRMLAGEGVTAFGCDASIVLLADAAEAAPVVRCVLPDLAWIRDDSIDSAVSVFVLDLIEDAGRFFSEAARVVRPGGAMVVVINHPAFTAPGSAPIVDLDGEVLWRWGDYLETGSSEEPAGGRSIVFYHRPTGVLLSLAAAAGWGLEMLDEAPLGPATIEREAAYAGQQGIPRFLAGRWSRSSD